MNPKLLFILCLSLISEALYAGIDITDAAGRQHRFQEPVKRVYTTSPVGAIYLYTIAPEVLIGWNYKPSEFEYAHMLPEMRELPILGGWFGKNGTANLETLLAAKPDVILSIGPLNKVDIEFANQLEAQTGIPVLVGDLSLTQCEVVYEMLGKLLGKEKEAMALSDYCTRTLTEMEALTKALPEAERLSFYYAEGMKGLETDSRSSMHTETFLRAGAENVCDLTDQANRFGRSIVSLEQILLWNPEVIFIGRDRGEDFTRKPEWLEDELWAGIPAVQTGRVYQIPNTPFNWVDRPPSVNRILGLRWVFWTLYPDKTNYDMTEEVETFFKLFYHYEMNHAEAKELLQKSCLLR